MTYEHATDGANATVDFIEWVQKEGASNGLDQTTIDDLLSGARVELVDERVEERADKLAGALNDPELLEQAGQWFAESADDIDLDETDRMLRKAGLGKALQIEADEAGDWVQAADRAGGPELVEQMVRAAADDNPWFVRRYLSNLNQIDGSRAKVVAEILAETESFGPAAQHYLDILEGELPWWAAAMPGPAAL